MPDRLASSAEADTRFQYEVIKGLSESIRQQSASTERLAAAMADMQKTQVGMLERLAKLEANRVGEIVADIRLDMNTLESKVAALLREKDQRQGAYAVFAWLRVWGPVIFSLFAALWLFGRSLGIVPAPPVPTPTQTTRDNPDRKGGQ
jgi:uncharacterized coiled-coil protein SlyX